MSIVFIRCSGISPKTYCYCSPFFLLLLLLLRIDCLQKKTHTCKLHMNLKLGMYLTWVVTSWWGHQISNYDKLKFNIKKNHISTTTRGKFTIFAPLYRSLIVKKYLQKCDPNLTFTSCPNRKSKFVIKKNHISTTAKGKFKIFAPLYRWLIVKNIYKKVTRIWPLLPVQTSCQCLIFKKKIISQQPKR